ncbi:MAG: RNA polymerase sigma factor [Spirochaetota bacterium]
MIDRLQARAPEAQKEAYQRHGPELFRFIQWNMRGTLTDAEDVLQEVFISAFEKIDTLSPDGNLRAWLYRIARNKCIDTRRRERSYGRYTKKAYEVREERTMEDTITAQDIQVLVAGSVRELPDILRAVFTMRQYEEMPYEEIALATETSLSRVKKAMAKAVLMLGASLKSKGISKDMLR